VYTGELGTRAVHELSGTVIETDAPRDNQGKGEKFSPTDLVATSLGSCMLTTMGISARDKQLALDGTTAAVEKIMISNPRRIAEIKVHINFPGSVHCPLGDRAYLERVALNCPVAKSLHTDIKQSVSFHWQEP